MPLVRTSLRKGKSPEYRDAIADGIHRAMVETIGVPLTDRFQLITEHDRGGLICDPTYLNIQRTDDVVFVQITLNTGRSLEMKKALYAGIVRYLAESPGIRPQDVLINLVEVPKENWSFGNGEAQYA
jgi:phenylpyruvate tautomerase PptA (4-oxalocrotonate tautomerase family)